MPRMVKVPTVRMSKAAISRGSRIGPFSHWREVYKCKTNPFVFKVVKSIHSPTEDGVTANSAEYRNYLFLKSKTLPEGIKLPEMYLLSDGTLAAEFIDGRHPDRCTWKHDYDCHQGSSCWLTRVKVVAYQYNLKDLHYQNVLIARNGDIYLIDLDSRLEPLRD